MSRSPNAGQTALTLQHATSSESLAINHLQDIMQMAIQWQKELVWRKVVEQKIL
jgi:hypothetical protein